MLDPYVWHPSSLIMFLFSLNLLLLTQKRLNEDVIDFDLLEDLICYIDENCPPGAILVFLPVSL